MLTLQCTHMLNGWVLLRTYLFWGPVKPVEFTMVFLSLQPNKMQLSVNHGGLFYSQFNCIDTTSHFQVSGRGWFPWFYSQKKGKWGTSYRNACWPQISHSERTMAHLLPKSHLAFLWGAYNFVIFIYPFQLQWQPAEINVDHL